MILSSARGGIGSGCSGHHYELLMAAGICTRELYGHLYTWDLTPKEQYYQ